MPLNFGNGGGDYAPYVKYNSKASRWYTKGENGEVEIPNPTFVADMPNIKTGWLRFVEGMAPERVWDESLSSPAARPSENHKRGFLLTLFSPKSFGGKGVVELSSSSMHLCAAINDLYDAYEKDAGANAGKLPVVSCTGSTAMKDKMGTNYRPTFEITKWVDRPKELSGEGNAPAPAPQAAPPKAAPASVSEF